MPLNDLVVANSQYAAAAARYEAGLAHQTQYTWMQRSLGGGYKQIRVPFDVWFTEEPVVTSGAALVSITHNGYLPIASALVVSWWARPGGIYYGADVVLNVDLRVASGLIMPGRRSGGGGSDPAVPVVAHHLTFAGPAITPSAADLAASQQKPRATGAGV